MLTTHTYNARYIDKNITQGKVEGAIEVVYPSSDMLIYDLSLRNIDFLNFLCILTYCRLFKQLCRS